jgi:hypothetical protein
MGKKKCKLAKIFGRYLRTVTEWVTLQSKLFGTDVKHDITLGSPD